MNEGSSNVSSQFTIGLQMRPLWEENSLPPAAGRVSLALSNWQKLTKDQWVLEAVQGLKIPFVEQPYQKYPPFQPHLSAAEAEALEGELCRMRDAGTIEPAPHPLFLSTHFVVPKASGKYRPVFNLKSLNEYLVADHFKMESLTQTRDILCQDAWLCTIDLKDAYHTILVDEESRPFLAFRWKGKAWQYRCLPFGLNIAPWVFTKLTKPIAGLIRSQGIPLTVYLDDWLTVAPTAREAKKAAQLIVKLLEALGFTINVGKSVLQPTQQIVFLGTQIDTQKMTLSLPSEKLAKILHECRRVSNNNKVSVTELRSLLGKMIAARHGVRGAMLHVRGLQRLLLQMTEDQRQLTVEAVQDLAWWIQEAPSDNSCPIHLPLPCLLIQSDASNLGWGATCQGQNVGGPWRRDEMAWHINRKELMAAFLGLKTFASNLCNAVVELELDNVSAVAHINRQGGTHSFQLCHLAIQVWEWALARHLHLDARHLAGRLNVQADFLSRNVTDNGDIQLNRRVFHLLQEELGPFALDLFAARHNTQLKKFVSWHLDPEAVAVNAFYLPPVYWEDAYAFPPINQVTRCLHYVHLQHINRLFLVAPAWPTQVYYAKLLRMLTAEPILLSASSFSEPLIHNPDGSPHKLVDTVKLVAWTISGQPQQGKAFRKRLQNCGCRVGERVPTSRMKVHGRSGFAGVVDGVLIPWAVIR